MTLKAPADPLRWRLVQALADGPRTTGALAEGFDQTRFWVMKHLEVLVAAALVMIERRGRECWNHLTPVPLAGVLDSLTTPLGRDRVARPLALHRAIATLERPTDSPRMIDIRQQIRLPAPPARVFDVLPALTDLWWTAPYRMTEGGRIALAPRIGGELHEERPGRHVSVWGRGEEVAPGRRLVLAPGRTADAGRTRASGGAATGDARQPGLGHRRLCPAHCRVAGQHLIAGVAHRA